jgi:hypothetical protein
LFLLLFFGGILLFYDESINRQEDRTRKGKNAGADKRGSAFLDRWAFKPVAEWGFNARRAKDEACGEGGENNAFLHLKLPRSKDR